MTATHRSLLTLVVVWPPLFALTACTGTETGPPIPAANCDALIQLARTTGRSHTYSGYPDTPTDAGELPRTGLKGFFGMRSAATIFVRENSHLIPTPDLERGEVVALVTSRHSDKHLKTKGGGDHYWAVARSDGGWFSVMAPVDAAKRPQCTWLYVKDRGGRMPYEAKFLSKDDFQRAGILLARAAADEGAWVACGAMCCCTGRASICEEHDVALQPEL